MRIEPFSLTGHHVRLEPLEVGHVPALLAAAQADNTTYGFTAVPHDVAAMTAYVEGLLADAARDAVVPFAAGAGRRRCAGRLHTLHEPGLVAGP